MSTTLHLCRKTSIVGTTSRSSWRTTYPHHSRSQRTVKSGCACWEGILAVNKTAAHRTSPDLSWSLKKFDNEIFWSFPLSTKQKPLDFYFNYNDPSGAPVAAV